jgi:hypothetical protein
MLPVRQATLESEDVMAEKKAAAKKPAAKKPAARKAAPKKAEAPVVVTDVQVYKDESGEWRWRALAGNHKIVASSGEGLRNRMYAAKVARDLYPFADVYFV